MFVFVGLGNPGEQYQHTRHNIGWLFLDYLVAQMQPAQEFQHQKKFQAATVKVGDLLLVKPQTFMNLSGVSAQVLTHFYKDQLSHHALYPAEQFSGVYVIHDDLDIESGSYKIQFQSGPKIHNGVNSVREQLGTTAFWTVRIGVDGRQGKREMSGSEYVLKNLTSVEESEFQPVFQRISQQVLLAAGQPLKALML